LEWSSAAGIKVLGTGVHSLGVAGKGTEHYQAAKGFAAHGLQH
jgi:hypothetical protein